MAKTSFKYLVDLASGLLDSDANFLLALSRPGVRTKAHSAHAVQHCKCSHEKLYSYASELQPCTDRLTAHRLSAACTLAAFI